MAEDKDRAPGLPRRKFLPGIGTGAVAVSVAPTQLTATHNEKMTAKSTRPNIVYFFVDDMGYGDASCLNPDGKIQTPNIDRLAREGMVFTDAHSSSAVCSPSRYSLLTGRYNWRSTLQKGIVGLYGPPLIPTDRLTAPAFLSQHGYHTACIGKWHLGQGWDFESDEKDFHPRSNYDPSPIVPDADQQASPTTAALVRGLSQTDYRWPDHTWLRLLFRRGCPQLVSLLLY